MPPFVPQPGPSGKPKLLDQVRQLLRARRYSLRTEEAYLGWIRRYILFHGKRHPAELGEEEVSAFLSHLAVEGEVAASTQNQHVKLRSRAGSQAVKSESVLRLRTEIR